MVRLEGAPGIALCAALLACTPAWAQEMEPRAYSPSPIGTTFVVVGVGRSFGSVLVDAALPVENVDAQISMATLAVGHTFALARRQALVLAAFPMTWANVSGEVGEDSRSVSRRGLADPRFKLSINLAGSPALRPAEFIKAPRRTVVGASVTVAPPIGQYDRTKLINLGANRWSFKPEVGVSHPIGRWTLEGFVGMWLFTTNDEFYMGNVRRTQDPIVALQAHTTRTIGARGWIAFDGTWYRGGETTVDGIGKADLQRNSRLGATLSVPLGRRQSIKASYTTGATTRTGADFETFGVAWQIVLF